VNFPPSHVYDSWRDPDFSTFAQLSALALVTLFQTENQEKNLTNVPKHCACIYIYIIIYVIYI